MHQPIALNRLRRALSGMRAAHAYLFTGPPGVGKEMLASRVAQLLLCSNRDGGDTGQDAASSQGLFVQDESNARNRPSARNAAAKGGTGVPDACGQCTDCTLFAAGTHPDFHRIYRTLNKLHPDKKVRDRKAIDLSIDVIRHFVLGRIGLRPARDRAKVFIVIEADRMSAPAQNAMLKTLEEPPGDSFIIMLSAAPDLLLPTTRSRCQQIPFGTLPDGFIQEQLVARLRIPTDQAAFLTQLGQGSVGEALRFAAMGVFDRVADVIAAAKRAIDDPLAAGKALAELAKEMTGDAGNTDDEENADTNAAREAQALVIAIAAVILRDMQRVVVGLSPAALPGRPEISDMARGASPRRVGRAIKELGTAEHQIDWNANTSLIFDSVGIAIGRALGEAAALTR
jgi:DNA polymerase-3 subunit delta'